jgi:hypothetical protein
MRAINVFDYFSELWSAYWSTDSCLFNDVIVAGFHEVSPFSWVNGAPAEHSVTSVLYGPQARKVLLFILGITRRSPVRTGFVYVETYL